MGERTPSSLTTSLSSQRKPPTEKSGTEPTLSLLEDPPPPQEPAAEVKARPKRNVGPEMFLKGVNLILCLLYLIISIGLSVVIHQAFWKAGKILREEFHPGTTRLPSPLLPIWYHIPDQLPFGQWLNHIYMASIALCVIWVVDYLHGLELCLDGTRKDCKVFACLMIITIIAQTIVLLQVYDTSKSINQEAINLALEKIERDYEIVGINAVTAALNMMMIKGECCGLEGPHDFKSTDLRVKITSGVNPYSNIITFEDSPEWLKHYEVPIPNYNFSRSLKFPSACCSEKVFTVEDPNRKMDTITRCTSYQDFAELHKRGCYGYFFDNYVAVPEIRTTIILIYVVECTQLLLVIGIHMLLPKAAPPPLPPPATPSVPTPGDTTPGKTSQEPSFLYSDEGSGSTRV